MDDSARNKRTANPVSTQASSTRNRFSVIPFYHSLLSLPVLGRLRYVLVALSVLILIGVPIAIGYWVILRTGSRSYFHPIAYNDMIQAAIEIRLDESKNLFQTGLVLVAGLWGLLIAKKDEAVLVFKDVPELIMSFSAALLFLLSFTFHILYLRKITEVYISSGVIMGQEAADALKADEENKIPITIVNIFAANVDFLFVCQTAFLVSAAFIALLTFISAHKLK